MAMGMRAGLERNWGRSESMMKLLRRLTAVVGGLLMLTWWPAAWAQAAPMKLRVVGGLAGTNQFTRHEAPFWTSELARLSAGKYSADIVPFDRAGIRGQELLSMVRLGTVPFGTLLVSIASPKDAELSAPDLAGLNPDPASLRRAVTAFRPRLQALLRERHGAELLAVYVYPAQVLFCNAPLASLGGLRGRKVRTSSLTQADWVEALGGRAVNMQFAEVVPNMRTGNMDCAITGTMSGNTIGLHEITTHLHAMAIGWGMSVFVAHGATWRSLPEDLRSLLQRELPKLEAAIWDEAARETEEGIACNSGDSACKLGKPGKMTVLRPGPADEVLRRDILTSTVLPRWLLRCGPACATSWNQYMAPVTGLQARTP
jgi:TRAP-type C4-dicarboxylate transport system substrate-binding protein